MEKLSFDVEQKNITLTKNARVIKVKFVLIQYSYRQLQSKILTIKPIRISFLSDFSINLCPFSICARKRELVLRTRRFLKIERRFESLERVVEVVPVRVARVERRVERVQRGLVVFAC